MLIQKMLLRQSETRPETTEPNCFQEWKELAYSLASGQSTFIDKDKVIDLKVDK